MNISTLMTQLANEQVPHFNIWFGEEQKILDLYIERISTIGYKLVFVDSVRYVLDQIGKKSLDRSNKCYVVTEDQDFTKAEDKWQEVNKRLNSSNHILICRYNSLNKTHKFYKQNQEICVEFLHLSADVLINYIKNNLPDLDDTLGEKLCEMCGNDYGRILLECNKIKNYSNLHKIDSNTSIKILLEQDAIYSDIGDITFKLTDAILYGDINKSLKYLQEANRKGEPALMIASILYTGFRNMLAVQGLGKNKEHAVERTGLQYWQIKQVLNNIGGYSIKDVERNMLFCQSVEAGIKTGKLDFDNVLDYLVINCLK